jgi:ribosomal-protein-serine acetyltransferase
MFRRTVAPGIELRQFQMEDAEPTFALVERHRGYLREWLPWVDHTRSPDDVRDFIARVAAQWEADQGPQTAIWVEGAIRGSLGCHPIDWPNQSASVGYWIEPGQQGRGIVTRCTIAMLDYLFGELGLHRVEIRCAPGNTRSCAIPERLGFAHEGVAREAQWVGSRWVDLVVWSMLAGDWKRRGKS